MSNKLPGGPRLLAASTAINTIARWLAVRDVESLAPRSVEEALSGPADLMILFGACLPAGWDVAARAVREGAVRQLLVVGGIGHSTEAWWRLVEREGLPGVTAVHGRAEADVIADYLRAQHDLSDVWVERRSTNCGANIAEAQRVVAAHGWAPRSVVLVQDPSMQRRMQATFERTWRLGSPRVLSFAAYRPGLTVGAGGLTWADPAPGGLWAPEHFASLVLGEVPRLLDTPNGYGPRGRDFLAHVHVPDAVLSAFEVARDALPHLVRQPDARWAST